MRGVATLATRIRRLEKRRGSRREKPALVFALANEPADRIVGVATATGQTFNRRWGEGLASLAQRAREGTGAPRAILTAIYPPEPPPAAVAPSPVAPEAPPVPKFNRAASTWHDWRTEKGY